MRAQVIVIPGNETSELGFNRLLKSYQDTEQEFSINNFEASTPFTAESEMNDFDITWNYPWEGKVSDIKSGLIKSAYPTADKRKRISCFMSHWYLWQKCVKLDETILLLEHDSRLIKKLPADSTFARSPYDIIGINDPSMATRKSKVYHDMILEREDFFQSVPRIDEFNIPQGLAGNSAYVIKPEGAQHMLNLANEYGMWPNDALMCYQLVPKLGVTRNFYTRIQGLRSTTTL